MGKTNRKIIVKDIQITISTINNEDFISLTDMVKGFEGGTSLIEAWFRNKNTIEFLGTWERVNNPDFKTPEFEGFKSEAGLNRFSLSAKRWIEGTNAIGIKAKAGRYGGTYAHKDIAFEFGAWLSPEFKLYLIKEFQRLKEDEAERLSVEWQVNRELAKINYQVHTDAIQQNLLFGVAENEKRWVYTSEADMLNMVVFGQTAKEWRDSNPGNKGNQRDNATALDNAIIANLEFLNSNLIEQGLDHRQRLQLLQAQADKLRETLRDNAAVKRLEKQIAPK